MNRDRDDSDPSRKVRWIAGLIAAVSMALLLWLLDENGLLPTPDAGPEISIDA